MDAINNSTALLKDAVSPNALWQNTTIRAHVSGEQTVFASGKYKGTESLNGKEYVVYETEQPASMEWQIGAAMYRFVDTVLENNLDLRILYDEKHHYNLKHMQDAVSDGIYYLESHLGAYPYSQLHITEVPFYNDENFYATPNQIAISEKHCWTADGSRDKDLSYIYYTLCREIIDQWLQQNIHVADVQGADMFLKAIPEAYALAYVQEKFGEETLQVYIEKKEDRYGKGRGTESNTEPPLIYADGADYLEANKGGVELLKVIQELGITKFSSLLTEFINERSGNNKVFMDFYREIQKNYPEIKKEDLSKAFEEVLI
jgi:hypothetical protein